MALMSVMWNLSQCAHSQSQLKPPWKPMKLHVWGKKCSVCLIITDFHNCSKCSENQTFRKQVWASQCLWLLTLWLQSAAGKGLASSWAEELGFPLESDFPQLPAKEAAPSHSEHWPFAPVFPCWGQSGQQDRRELCDLSWEEGSR